MNRRTCLLAACMLAAAHPAVAQGPLNPPGGPAPTMKSLDQIDAKVDQNGAKLDTTATKVDEIRSKAEKRIALNAADSPAGVDTANANYHFIINQPGSYYLPANLGVTKANGIQINAAGVTLDLNGFEISRASGTGGNGIEIVATSHRATVRNGSLKGFAFGIRSLSDLVGNPPRACNFRHLSVSNCTNVGIEGGIGAVLESCRAHDNSGTYGLYASSGSSLTDCTAAYNTVTYGIFVESGSSLTNCSAYVNTKASGASGGISTGPGCTITDCTSFGNTSTAAAASSITGVGFNVGDGSTIQRCTARDNKGDGISLGADGAARDNTCDSNGRGGDGAGIHVTSSDNRIEGNNVTENDRGIDVDVAGNLIVKNSASGNVTNYDIVASNSHGPIVNVSGVGDISATPNANHPWANFSY